MRFLLSLALAFSGLIHINAFAAMAVQGETQIQLHQVRKIYVGDMGDTDEADRFRLLLQDELSAKGFTVVDRAESSDAILHGALSVRVNDKTTSARVYVKLETPQGIRLWGKDFGSKWTSPFNRTEPVKYRARDVANALKKAWDKSQK